MVVNASFDREMDSYFEETAKDGFQILLGRIMTGSESPIAIPSGADALVTIATKKQEELSDCFLNNHIPKLKYFDHYDPYGALSYTENILVTVIEQVGCDMPFLTHYLQTNLTYGPACPIDVHSFLKAHASDDISVGNVKKVHASDDVNVDGGGNIKSDDVVSYYSEIKVRSFMLFCKQDTTFMLFC